MARYCPTVKRAGGSGGNAAGSGAEMTLDMEHLLPKDHAAGIFFPFFARICASASTDSRGSSSKHADHLGAHQFEDVVARPARGGQLPSPGAPGIGRADDRCGARSSLRAPSRAGRPRAGSADSGCAGPGAATSSSSMLGQPGAGGVGEDFAPARVDLPRRAASASPGRHRAAPARGGCLRSCEMCQFWKTRISQGTSGR